MLNRKIIFPVIALFLVLICSISSAESFYLRNGITWGQQPERITQILMTETGSENYFIYMIPDSLDASTAEAYNKSIYQHYPLEEQYHQMWMMNVNGVSLDGDEKFIIVMSLAGTKKDGLLTTAYMFYANGASENDVYNKAQAMLSQLEKKYGSFPKHKSDIDNWTNRKKTKTDDVIFQKYKDLSDNTSVFVVIQNFGNNEYILRIEYQSPNYQEVDKSMTDGTYYIEPAFGL